MLETLTCAICCNPYSRERTRGRKPQRCPSCRPIAKRERSDLDRERDRERARRNYAAGYVPPARRGACASCGATIQVGSTSAKAPRCRACRAPRHGDLAMYDKRGCRCDLCRQAKAAAMLEYAHRYRAKHGVVPSVASRKRRGVRENGSWIGTRRRVAIYERDGWCCQICGEPVTADESNTDLAPSLDHVIPRSLGGSDEDANLQCAHRVCNSRKGASVAA